MRVEFALPRVNDLYLTKPTRLLSHIVGYEGPGSLLAVLKQWGLDDDAIFDQYAQMCLDEYVDAGKDPKPIELVMKKIKQQAD